MLLYNGIVQTTNMNTDSKYHITMSPIRHSAEVNPIELYADTHQDIADVINSSVGYNMVSRTVIINWICRKKKSKKYDWIDVQFNSNRKL
jgi:hypothetical protein